MPSELKSWVDMRWHTKTYLVIISTIASLTTIKISDGFEISNSKLVAKNTPKLMVIPRPSDSRSTLIDIYRTNYKTWASNISEALEGK